MIEVLAQLAKAHLDAGRPLRTRAVGHSMWPFVKDGEQVTIVPLVGPPRVGDIVLVEAKTTLVLHRVVAYADDHVVTKGDAEPTIDGRVARDRILGRLRDRSSCVVAHASRLGGPPLARLLHAIRRRLSPAAKA